ncbi:ASCH domain-containing protein [Photobacterium damselae]
MSQVPTKITFFEWLAPLIVSGNKTITIRDESESYYLPDSQVEVFTLETNKKFCEIEIESVEPILFEEINEFHAQQEFMELQNLKDLIKEIYPDQEQLYVIAYKLLAVTDK